jgi:site-specific DNA recombinase
MNKALIYCRVSTEEQAGDERHSLKTQLRLCEKAIEESKIFVLAEDGVYKDPGKSATNMNRPGLQDMLIRVQEDKSVKAVFLQDTDRLARNANDHLTIKALLRKHDVQIVSVSQPGLENTPEGNFMDLVIAGVNQLQSQITSRKTIKSVEQKFKDGWWPTKAPVGYFNSGDPDDEKKRIITTDPVRGPLIAEAFKLYARGDNSMIEIRDIMYKKGLVSPAGKIIANSKMFEMFKCHFYYGEMRWRGMVQMGNHKPLITKELFEKCERVMAENNHYVCRRRKFNFILRGFVFCNKCGQRYTAEHHPLKNKSYYHCNKKNPAKKCDNKYIELKTLEGQVEQKFQEMQFSERFINQVIEKLRTIYESKKSNVSHGKRQYLTSKLNAEKKLEVAEEKLINGILSDEEFTRIKKKYREQIDGLEDEIHKLEMTKNLKIDVIQEVLLLIRDIGKAYKKAPPDLKRIYLGLFWDEFRAEEKGIVSARKSTIVEVLESAGMLTTKELRDAAEPQDDKPSKPSVTQKPDPMDRVFEGQYTPSILPFSQAESPVILRPERGGQRESNSHFCFHKAKS